MLQRGFNKSLTDVENGTVIMNFGSSEISAGLDTVKQIYFGALSIKYISTLPFNFAPQLLLVMKCLIMSI